MDFSTFSMKISKEDLKTQYGPIVSNLCKRLFTDTDKAKKIASVIYDKLMDDYDNYTGERSTQGWIFSTAKDTVYESSMDEPFFSERSLREKHTDVDVKLPTDENEKEKVVIGLVDEYLTKVIHNMDIVTRYGYVLYDTGQLPYRDISSILGKTEHEMRKHISRTRRKLTNFLEESCIIYNNKNTTDSKLKDMITDIKLAKKLKSLRRTSHKVNVLTEMDLLTGGVNYWNE